MSAETLVSCDSCQVMSHLWHLSSVTDVKSRTSCLILCDCFNVIGQPWHLFQVTAVKSWAMQLSRVSHVTAVKSWASSVVTRDSCNMSLK